MQKARTEEFAKKDFNRRQIECGVRETPSQLGPGSRGAIEESGGGDDEPVVIPKEVERGYLFTSLQAEKVNAVCKRGGKPAPVWAEDRRARTGGFTSLNNGFQ